MTWRDDLPIVLLIALVLLILIASEGQEPPGQGTEIPPTSIATPVAEGEV